MQAIRFISRNDYGVRSLESILDMVKVMSFALKEGKVTNCNSQQTSYCADELLKKVHKLKLESK